MGEELCFTCFIGAHTEAETLDVPQEIQTLN